VVFSGHWRVNLIQKMQNSLADCRTPSFSVAKKAAYFLFDRQIQCLGCGLLYYRFEVS